MIQSLFKFVVGYNSGIRNEKELKNGSLKYKLSNRKVDQQDDALTKSAPERF